MTLRPAFYALLAALLFGASTPAAKGLLGTVHPIILAGLLYCGAGVGAALLRRLGTNLIISSQARERPLGRSEYPWLAGAIIAGGMAGPLLLMIGLARIDAGAASLLLTFEGAATALMAWFIFGESFNRRVALGMACLIGGAIVVSWSGTPTVATLTGPLAIIGACLAWGLDNNLTRKVSLADPLQIVEIKGFIAGPVNLLLGFWAGGSLPDLASALTACVVGIFGYGVSLGLFILALRHLGAARTSAYFSTAPFIGAAVAVIGLGESMTVQLITAGGLMSIGVWLHLSERHEHQHSHELTTHSHPHTHDEHHQHGHRSDDPAGDPHTHVHAHGGLRHAHPHMPDMHHQHRH